MACGLHGYSGLPLVPLPPAVPCKYHPLHPHLYFRPAHMQSRSSSCRSLSVPILVIPVLPDVHVATRSWSMPRPQRSPSGGGATRLRGWAGRPRRRASLPTASPTTSGPTGGADRITSTAPCSTVLRPGPSFSTPPRSLPPRSSSGTWVPSGKSWPRCYATAAGPVSSSSSSSSSTGRSGWRLPGCTRGEVGHSSRFWPTAGSRIAGARCFRRRASTSAPSQRSGLRRARSVIVCAMQHQRKLHRPPPVLSAPPTPPSPNHRASPTSPPFPSFDLHNFVPVDGDMQRHLLLCGHCSLCIRRLRWPLIW